MSILCVKYASSEGSGPLANLCIWQSSGEFAHFLFWPLLDNVILCTGQYIVQLGPKAL